jgi:hypothetical protein
LNRTKDTQTGKVTRRDFLRQGGTVPTLAAVGAFAPFGLSGCSNSACASPIKVGLLHSQTGTMAISETPLRDAGILAIEVINAGGGVLGRPIEAVIEDTRSRMTDLFPKKARKLLVEHKVAAAGEIGVSSIFGEWGEIGISSIFGEKNVLTLRHEARERRIIAKCETLSLEPCG